MQDPLTEGLGLSKIWQNLADLERKKGAKLSWQSLQLFGRHWLMRCGVQVNDTVMFDIETGKIKDFIKFDVGQLVMVTGGRNVGRVGTIVNRQKHKGSFDIIVVKDSVGHQFATR